MVDALADRAVERAVLGVEVEGDEQAARREQPLEAGQPGGRVLDVVQHELRDGRVERRALGQRVGDEVEVDRADVAQVPLVDLAPRLGEHALGRVREHELGELVEQGQSDESRAGADLDRPAAGWEPDRGSDRRRGGARPSEPLWRVPRRRPGVEALRVEARARLGLVRHSKPQPR